MKTVTFYVAALLCLLATKLNAQGFDQQVKDISNNIEKITKQEKDSLKMEVDRVNKMLIDNEITQEEANRRKQEYADVRARNIETRVAAEEEKLNQLVKDKVDGKIEDDNSFVLKFGNKKKDSTKVGAHSYRRTTSQFVFALGVNRLVADGEVDTDNYKWRSDFYEWGITWNTRLLKDNNLLHAKYGLSLQYNNLRPDGNKMFVRDGGQTVLVESDKDLDVARLRYTNLVVPAHLEFDFTKKKVNGETVYFPSHKSFRVGVGGYAGVNIKEKQILKYHENGHKVRHKEKGNFNVNDFIYGVSGYIGYGEISLYAKYDLQPIFNNNEIDENTLSLGIRFDFN